MFQVDRQWEFIAKVEKQIEEQSKDLSELRRLVRSGKPLSSFSNETNQDPDGAWQGFDRLAEITGRKDYAPGDWIVDAFSVSSPTMTPLIAGDAYAAIMTRQHNNANVLCIGARNTDPNTINEIVHAFLVTNFDGGRHQKRISKFS